MDLYTLSGSGLVVAAIAYGARIVALRAPDRRGRWADLVLGFDSFRDYLAPNPCVGAIVGRCANRIAAARFDLDGRMHTLRANDGPHHLHGGAQGFDRRWWRAQIEGDSVVMRYRSVAGEEGYPGNLDVEVRYRVTGCELQIDSSATADAPTLVNLTQHGFFNLSGNSDAGIDAHRLRIAAQRFTPIDHARIPTGELRPVAGTPFDFRTPRAIGSGIDGDDEQLRCGDGYDHNFVLDAAHGQLNLAAELADPDSGRKLELFTTEPGLQFYSGNFLDGTLRGKGGATYRRRSALCLEPQHFPDAPHHAHFPSVVLRPGRRYRSRSVLRFSVEH